MMKSKILLLIEDNPLLTAMYRAAFEKKGVEVFLAHDGETGLKLAQDKKPDIILLDLLLPGADGFDILEQLRRDPGTKELKVVVLTIVKKEGAEERAKKLGVIDYLIKTELELHEIVERVTGYF